MCVILVQEKVSLKLFIKDTNREEFPAFICNFLKYDIQEFRKFEKYQSPKFLFYSRWIFSVSALRDHEHDLNTDSFLVSLHWASLDLSTGLDIVIWVLNDLQQHRYLGVLCPNLINMIGMGYISRFGRLEKMN